MLNFLDELFFAGTCLKKIQASTGLESVPPRYQFGATELRSHMLEARKILLGSLFPKVEFDQCRFYKNFILFGECRFYKKFHFVDFSMENDVTVRRSV